MELMSSNHAYDDSLNREVHVHLRKQSWEPDVIEMAAKFDFCQQAELEISQSSSMNLSKFTSNVMSRQA